MAFIGTDRSIQTLQEQITGRVLTPDDVDYEQARLPWNRSTNHYPALILIAENVEDVKTGVRYAREAGLGIAIQSTGHGIQRPADDALLIVTSRMSSVNVDAQARTARVEAGVIWQQVVDEAVPHRLAPLLGSSPHVGVIGYTLGGGIGWLARHYGLAADSVRSIEIVTPDGELRFASSTENSELFWGLRGGGGNFGVVTAMTFDLYPVATLYGGSLTYPAELAGGALRFFREWIKTVPDELTSSIAILKYPTLPQLPEAMRGKVEVIVRAAYIGDRNTGEALMQPWLDWQRPSTNAFRQLPFAEIATISNDPVDPVAGHGTNEMLSELGDEVIAVILHQMQDSASPLLTTELRHAGGAIARVPVDENAIGNRDALFYLQMAGLTPTTEAKRAVKSAIHDYRNALAPYVQGGVYLNFTKSSEEDNRTANAYSPSIYVRLLALKAKYDPNNLFRFSYPLVQAESA
jgi:hypothetical protein